jgi:hypothetical protein
MDKPKFISSLHRPFNTRLKTCKWVCSYAQNYQGTNFKNDFFLHIIKKLQDYYKNNDSVYGLPSKEAIDFIYQYILDHPNIEEVLVEFGNPQKKNETEIDKKLFSNLKAVSYYITLSKNLGLIGSKFTLTEEGLQFSNFRNSNKGLMVLSSKEQVFLTNKILENDLIPFLFSLFYYRLKKKYEPSDIEIEETNILFLKYLDSFLNLREFKYKQSSWRNYIKVRESWIEDLELLSKTHNLKPTYKKLIENDLSWMDAYQEISLKMIEFEKIFKTLDKYRSFKKNLYAAYKRIKKTMIFSNIDYVNLYDIKNELKISYAELEMMLNRLTEDTNNKRKVFFNNIIAAVDQRKRFKVKNSSVLNIRITKVLT